MRRFSKNIVKFISAVLVAVMFMACLPTLQREVEASCLSVDIDGAIAYTPTSNTEACKTFILNSLLNNEAKTDVRDFALTRPVFRSVYIDVLQEHPELYYVGTSFRLSYIAATDLVTSVENKYPLSSSEKEAVDAKVNSIVASVDPSFTDLQKALYVHDYIIGMTEYAEAEAKAETTSNGHFHDMYGCLIQNYCVCDGYAHSYAYIMYKLGIQSRLIISNPMGHAWNQIKIGGNWYNVDCTWDDPTTNVQGRVYHKYFLNSDSRMADLGYSGYYSSASCTSISYDFAWWTDVKSQIHLYKGSYYYLTSDDNVYTLMKRTGSSVTVLKNNLKNIVTEGYSTYNYMIFMCGLGNAIYYHDNHNIYGYNILTGETTVVYTNSTRYIQSIYVTSRSTARVHYVYTSDNLYTNVNFTSKIPSEGWMQSGNDWYYYGDSGERTVGWAEINGTWYYFSNSGVMSVGWQLIDGRWYYFAASGSMATSWQLIDGEWYYFKASGAMLTGWQEIDGLWYYFTAGGKMVRNWREINGKWYYFNRSGAMQTSWQEIDGKWFYLGTSGEMRTGWQLIDGGWYYFNDAGVMKTGWQFINGYWYSFNDSGVMRTGWMVIDGNWYYFYNSGRMAQNIVIDNCEINSNGVWVK